VEIHLNTIALAAKEKENELKVLLKIIIAANAKEFDSIVLPIAATVTSEIDCKLCANCCKELEAGITPVEIETLSKLHGQSVESFINTELSREEKTGIQYLSKKPCIFLSCNLCSIYNSRPAACLTFPDLERPLVKYRIRKITALYGICPIVFHTIEQLKAHYSINDHHRN